MTDKPFRFRRVREIAGAFVLLAAALLLVGIVMHGQIRGWFEPKEIFEVTLPESGSQGIRAGSEVFILGNKSGMVKRIDLVHADTGKILHGFADVQPDKIRMIAIIEVTGGMSVFVGRDSKAVLKRDLGGFGSSFFEITRGDEPFNTDYRPLQFVVPPDVQDELTATVSEIRKSVTPALDAIAIAATNISNLAANLENKDGSFQGTLNSLNSLVARIDRGEGAFGVLLKDEQAKKDLSETLTNVKTTSENLSEGIGKLTAAIDGMDKGEGVLGTLLKDTESSTDLAEALKGINAATASLNTSLTSIEGGAKQFPATIAKTDDVVEEIGNAVLILQQALSDIQLLSEGLQNHWLVKGSVDDVKKDRDKASEAQQRADQKAAEAAARAADGEPEKKKRGLFFWRK